MMTMTMMTALWLEDHRWSIPLPVARSFVSVEVSRDDDDSWGTKEEEEEEAGTTWKLHRKSSSTWWWRWQ